MALEINEIDIRMRVADGPDQTRQEKAKDNSAQCGDRDFDAIVADATRRVLQRLQVLQER